MFSAAGISVSTTTTTGSGGTGTSTTEEFTHNITWVAPATTTQIDTAIGYGADGSAGTTSTETYYTLKYTTRFYRKDGGVDDVVSESPTHYSSPPTTSYCDPYVAITDSTVYNGSIKCYESVSYTNTTTGSAHNGAATTAFGKTFPGGVGGPADETTFSSILITPSTSYPIVVPSGGHLTITYYK